MNELRKVVALPKGDAIGLSAMTPHFGELELADFLDVLGHEISASPKVAGSPRLLWINVKPYAAKPVLEKIGKQGASIVFEEANQVYWPELDPARPLTSLATKILSHYAHAPIEERTERLLNLASEYQVNGVIALAYPGCRYGTTALPYILGKLSEAGLPAISLDEKLEAVKGDGEGELSALDEFLETLGGAA